MDTRSARRLTALLLVVLCAACTSTVSGTAAPVDQPASASSAAPSSTAATGPISRASPYGLPLTTDQQALEAAFARWRQWDPCGFFDLAAAAKIAPVGGTDAFLGLNTCDLDLSGPPPPLNANGTVTISVGWHASVDIAGVIGGPEPGAVPEQIGGHAIVVQPGVQPGGCDAFIALGVGGRSIDLGLAYGVGGQTAPSDPCTTERAMITGAVARLDHPPLRGAAPVPPAGTWSLQDPCAGVGELSRTHRVTIDPKDQTPYSCEVQLDGGRVFVGVRTATDPAADGGTAVTVRGRRGAASTSGTGEDAECTLTLPAGALVRPALGGDPVGPVLAVVAPTCDAATEVAGATLGA